MGVQCIHRHVSSLRTCAGAAGDGAAPSPAHGVSMGVGSALWCSVLCAAATSADARAVCPPNEAARRTLQRAGRLLELNVIMSDSVVQCSRERFRPRQRCRAQRLRGAQVHARRRAAGGVAEARARGVRPRAQYRRELHALRPREECQQAWRPCGRACSCAAARARLCANSTSKSCVCSITRVRIVDIRAAPTLSGPCICMHAVRCACRCSMTGGSPKAAADLLQEQARTAASRAGPTPDPCNNALSPPSSHTCAYRRHAE